MDDFSQKPIEPNVAEEDKKLAEIESKPLKPEKEFEPAPVVAKAGKEGRAKRVFGGFILTLLILGLAAAAGWFWWQNDQAQASLRAKEAELSAMHADHSTKDDKDTAVADIAELTAEEKAKLAAGNYYCALADFGCDKVVATVLKIQDVKAGMSGFAIVKATPATGSETNLWLANKSGEWVVIHEGSTAPSAATVEKFAIPADFRTLPAPQPTTQTTD